MRLPSISGEFRMVADPELIFTPTGVAVCKGRLVANDRKFNEETKEWVDDKVVWLRFVAFKKLAENIAESFTKGSLVLISGRLQTEEWETKENEKRQAYTIIVDTAGPSLAWLPARILEAQRQESTPSGSSAGGDPWQGQSPPDDQPPF